MIAVMEGDVDLDPASPYDAARQVRIHHGLAPELEPKLVLHLCRFQPADRAAELFLLLADQGRARAVCEGHD